MSRNIDIILSLKNQFTAPMSAASKSLQEHARKIEWTGKQIEKTGKRIETSGINMTKRFTTSVLTIAAGAGNMYLKFNDAMANINTLLDDPSHLKSYEKAVLNTSNQTGLDAKMMADGMYQAVSSLGDNGKVTEKIFNTMARSAKAGGAEVSDSVALISAGMKGYNSVSAETAQKISDLAFNTAKLGVTTFPEMAKSMQPLFPLASSLSMSYEELFGSMATLTGVTGNTAEVSTQLKAVFSNLMKPTTDMQKLIEKYGYQNGAAMIKSKGLGGTLQLLQKETGGQSDKLAKLFSSTEALTAMTALTGTQYDAFNQKTKELGNSTGATETAFKKLQTPADRIRFAFNALKNTAISFGQAVINVAAPYIVKFSEKIQQLQKWFDGLSQEQQQAIVKIALFAAALGPAMMVVGKLTGRIGKIIKHFGNLGKKAEKAGGLMKLALNLIKGPGGIAIAIIAAVVAAGILLYKNWDKICQVAEKLKKVVINVFKSCGLDVNKFKSIFQNAGTIIKQIATLIGMAIKGILKVMKPVVTFVAGVFVKRFKTAFRLAAGVATGLLSSISGTLEGIKTFLGGVIDFVSGIFTGNWKKAWHGVKDIFKGVFEALSGIAKAPLNAVIGLVNGAISGLNEISFDVPEWSLIAPGKHFGVNIPTIPYLYRGTDNWPGGRAVINEPKFGGEIVDLPGGTRVYPHDESVRMARADGKKTNIVINKLADYFVVREEADIEKTAEAVAQKIVELEPNLI
ncbi:phage tail tape measure protein [Anaerovorax odorimutans]|uniref:Phage tail tape measure protein n=1 Tax=Anaerovorax odorimutans TaxID=109327 RepID=A0ABT1RR41_9FIRM|nr:phage tail tape measure protein [Anaerovorax odorimutans]MCQ4637669.1 phage tail tape measure protein [Anaerovorax odorimutans]